MRKETDEFRWRWRVGGGIVLLAVLAATTAAAVAMGDGTPSRRRTVAFIATACGGGSLAGWMASRWPYRNPALAVAGGLAGVFLRVVPPLATLAWMQAAEDGLRDAGGARLLLGMYTSLLVTDILLNVLWAIRFRPAGRKKIAI